MDLFKNKYQILTVKYRSFFYRHLVTPSNDTDQLFLTGNSGEPLEKKKKTQMLEKEMTLLDFQDEQPDLFDLLQNGNRMLRM